MVADSRPKAGTAVPTVAKAVSNWMETLLCIQVQINTDGSNDSYINAAKAAGVLASAVIFFLPI